MKRIGFHLLLALLALGCSAKEPFHIRGELNRTDWVVRTCDSGESYRVMYTSTQAFKYGTVEEELGLKADEPALVEFDAVILGPSFPWEKYQTVGIASVMHIDRGSCPQAPLPGTR